jgi:hypothetical protein
MDSDEKVSWKSSCMESVGSQLRPQPLRPWPCFRLYTRAKDGTTIDLQVPCTFQNYICYLNGPKLEIFVAEFFTQSKPVWVDDLGTRKEIKFFLFLAFYFNFNRRNICLAMSATALKNYFCLDTSEKNLFLIASIYTLIGLGRLSSVLNFYSV